MEFQVSSLGIADGVATSRTSSQPASASRVVPIRARYDNAQYTNENKRSWYMADYYSAKSANSYQVRRQLRIRSRYEVANNPYLFGITDDNANDVIDTGPTLQITTSDTAYNRAIESQWKEWSEEVDLVEKLKTLKLAKTVDGEGFLVLKTVDDLYNSVKLFPVDIEADQVTTPAPTDLAQLWVDGLTLHPVTGRPTHYHVLKSHPGDFFFPNLNPLKVDNIAAKYVIHWFPKFRPGQVRGIPVFTSALDLFTELRDFRKSTLQKARIAAQLTAVLETDAPPPSGLDVAPDPMDHVNIDHGTMTTLYSKQRLKEFTTSSPNTTYDSFHEKCLAEACRPLAYPLNLALGTSMKFNFSSSKLDIKNYQNRGRVERKDCEKVALQRIFMAWWEEGTKIPKYFPSKPEFEVSGPPRKWHWPGFPALDEKVEADADISKINAGTQTWQAFWASRGHDWKEVMAQQAEEKKEIERLELIFGQPLQKQERITLDEADPGAEKEAANVA